MEIGSKAKKIIIWSASGLAAAGLLTGTFFTGMSVADNTEPASVTSEVDGERPERPERGDQGDMPQDNDPGRGDSQEQDSGDQDTQDKESQDKESEDKDSQDSGSAGPDRPERHGDNDGGPGRDGHGHGHGHQETEEEAPAEDAPAQS